MFCSNCGKRIQKNAKYCMYCGNPVNFIDDKDDVAKDVSNEENAECCVEYSVCSENDDYSNCVDGRVSFQKMFQKFFSKKIKEYFSFDGTYSRLEYFYARLIIYIAFFTIVVPCAIFPQIYILIAVPLTVAFVWLLCASYVKRLKDLDVSLWVMVIPPICGILMRGEVILTFLGIVCFIYYTACVMFVQGEKFKSKEDECIAEEDKKNTKDVEKDVNIEEFSIKDGCVSTLLLIAIAMITSVINN